MINVVVIYKNFHHFFSYIIKILYENDGDEHYLLIFFFYMSCLKKCENYDIKNVDLNEFLIKFCNPNRVIELTCSVVYLFVHFTHALIIDWFIYLFVD
jgi:hypothetical protein